MIGVPVTDIGEVADVETGLLAEVDCLVLFDRVSMRCFVNRHDVFDAHPHRSPSFLSSSQRAAHLSPRGVFSRQLFLGENLDTDKIEANYHDGVLRLTIPVAEKAKPRRIEISHDDHQTAINA